MCDVRIECLSVMDACIDLALQLVPYSGTEGLELSIIKNLRQDSGGKSANPLELDLEWLKF